MGDLLITGAEEIEAKLKALERKVSKKIVRSAVRAGAKPMLKGAKNNSKVMVGGEMGSLLARNLQTRGFKRQRKGQFGVFTATKTGDDVPEFVDVAKSGQRNYIPAAIEYGHVDRAGGFVPAIPFMRNAFDTFKRLAKKRFREKLWEGIRKAAI